MRCTIPAALVALGLMCASSVHAWPDVDVEVANGDKVTGTLLPATEVETLRVQLPKGARLTVVVKGLKPKRGKAPKVTFRVLDAGDADIAAGRVTAQGASGSTVRKLRVRASGEHRVEVRGDGTRTGNYEVTVSWTSPTRIVRKVQLAGAEVPLALAVDAGATAKMVAQRAGASAALPRLLRFEHVADDAVLAIAQPGAAARAHRTKAIRLRDGGDYRLIVGDAGVAGGGAKVTITVKPPKAGKRTIRVTNAQVGDGAGGDHVVGAVVGASGGTVLLPEGDALGLGGASLNVPLGAVSLPTALLIGSAPPITAGPAPDFRAAGPTVFFGPAGQKFTKPVTVTIPFNAAPFGGDFSTLVIVQRDDRGRTSTVPKPYTVDADKGTVSFPVSHFTSFRAFGRTPPVPSDLNDDGRPDVVYVDTDITVGEPDRVRVVLGGAGLVSRPIDARDVLFEGTPTNDSFGQALAVGDVNGDGVDDLLIGASEAALTAGRVFIFFGGASFTGSLDPEADADVVLRGEDGLSRLGTSLAVGQFVGDATPDVVVGTNNSSPFEFPETFVFEGGAALVSGAAPAVRITGPKNQLFASRVAAADVTGDGALDLLVASSFALPSENGAVYVFSGGAGFGSGAHTDADVLLTGAGDFERFGTSLAAGDVLGDGAAEIVVGTSTFGSLVEKVFVFRGGAGLASTTSASAEVILTGDGVVTTDTFGAALAVAHVGGDAKGDVLIGDRFLAATGVNPGGVAVYFGGAGLVSGGIADADALIVGEGHGQFFGAVVSGQDLDGDGVAEIVATAPLIALPTGLRGSLYVFTGGVTFPAGAGLAGVVLTGLTFGD